MQKAFSFFLFILLFSLSAKAQVPGSAIDVQHYSFTINLNDADNVIKGQAAVTVKFLKNANSLAINLVKKNSTGNGMLVSSVKENDKDITFKQDTGAINIYAPQAQGSVHTYTITYEGIPADGLIISTNKFGHRTFFGDNWPNRAHHWLPCVDDPADKASVEYLVTAPDHYQVVANGLKLDETELPGHLKSTHWSETAQLPTKVMVIGVADFSVDHPGDVNGIPVYTYVFPENSTAGFKGYAVADEILPFYISKIGPYAYKKLANVQSKTIFGGMENAGAIFYFENSVGYKGIEELMAHEIAHQWFGDAVSEKSFHHLWLSEGFATYLTNYYLESKYGADTLKKRMAADRIKVLEFEKKRLTPVVDTAVQSDYMQLLNANSYEKGSWVLHMLRRQLGDVVFWQGIRNYFAKYDGGNANTADLCRVMSQAWGNPLDAFFHQWLNTAGHPDLNIRWKYNPATHRVNMQVSQKQANLYSLALQVSINGKKYTVYIRNRVTNTTIPAGQNQPHIKIDPDVNLLASFTVNGN
jgi:aminopeptidase N